MNDGGGSECVLWCAVQELCSDLSPTSSSLAMMTLRLRVLKRALSIILASAKDFKSFDLLVELAE
jgi:hypothetical protein